MQRDRLRTQATDQQRDQYRTCDQSMDRIRTQAHDMAQAAAGSGFNAGQAQQQRDQLRQQIQTMQQEQDRLRQSLSSDQSGFAKQRTQNADRLRERVNTRLQELDQELAKPSPDAKRINETARIVEREMNAWQKEYRAMGVDLSLKQ